MTRKRTGSLPRYEAKHGSDHCKANRRCVECGTPLRGRRRRWCGDDCVNAYLIRSDPQRARSAVHERDRGVCARCSLDTDELRESIKEADKEAFAKWLTEWNHSHPEGTYGSALEPNKYCHLGYKRYQGPRLYTGRSPGEPWGARPSHQPRLWWMVREAREACLTLLGLERFLPWWWRKSYWDCDPIRPVCEGGGGCGLENLRTLCVPCHADRSGREATRRSRGGLRRIERRPDEECEFETLCERPNWCESCLGFRQRAKSVIGSRRAR